MNTAVPPLIFSWTPPRTRALGFLFFLIGSFLLHAVCFYVFQIVYPPTVALQPPPARVSVISPDDPESTSFLRWVESEDPALTTTTQRSPAAKPAELPPLQHIPSYATNAPKLKPLPASTAPLNIPSSAALGRVRTPPLLRGADAPALIRKTTVVFSQSLERGEASFLPDFSFHPSQPGAPANARYRVAIDGGGAIQFCFLIESSGDPVLDSEAQKFLRLCRFPSAAGSASDSLLWTIATVLWGNDMTPPANDSPAARP